MVFRVLFISFGVRFCRLLSWKMKMVGLAEGVKDKGDEVGDGGEEQPGGRV